MTTTIVLSLLLGMAVLGCLLMLGNNEELRSTCRGLKRSVDYLQAELEEAKQEKAKLIEGKENDLKTAAYYSRQEDLHMAHEADEHPEYHIESAGKVFFVIRSSNGLSSTIKVFDTEDVVYNKNCAEELLDMLKEELVYD